MPVQGEAYMEGYCYKSLLKVDRLIGGGERSAFRSYYKQADVVD